MTMVVNRQKKYAVDLAATREFMWRLCRVLSLARHDFNVCFVDDGEIEQLNATYRGRIRPTDVLSFPWQVPGGTSPVGAASAEFAGFLGDVVISVETARRNAQREGQSILNEIRWLILHGVLHLLGYDHEADHGEMAALEHSIRARLGIAASARPLQGRKR